MKLRESRFGVSRWAPALAAVVFLGLTGVFGGSKSALASGLDDVTQGVATAAHVVDLTRGVVQLTAKSKEPGRPPQPASDPQFKREALLYAAREWLVPQELSKEENNILLEMMMEPEQQALAQNVTVIGASAEFYQATVQVDRRGLYERLRERIRTLDAGKILAWAGNPRIIVVVEEKIDGQASSGFYASAEISGTLQEMGFDLVSGRQLQNVKEIETRLHGGGGLNDLAFLTTLAERYGAEIIVYAQVEASQRGFLPIGGNIGVAADVGIYTHNASMAVEVAQMTTAKVLTPLAFSWSPSAPAGLSEADQNAYLRKYGATSKEGSAKKAVEFLVGENCQDIANRIMDALMDMPSHFEVIIKKSPAKWRIDLVKKLRKATNVTSVNVSMFMHGNLHLRLQAERDMSQEDLIDLMTSLEDFPMDLDAEFPGRVTFAAGGAGQ